MARRGWLAAAATTGVVAVAAWLAWSAGEPSPVASVRAAPQFAAVTLDATPQPRSLDSFRGAPLLLNVWATWCDPCREEMPSLQRLYDLRRERGLQVVAVSVDDAGSERLLREFRNEHRLTFAILHDREAAIMRDYQVFGVPQTFLIDRHGAIVAMRFAEDWNSPRNLALVDSLLLVPDAP